MGKRKWRRVRPADLADEKTQEQILSLINRANGQPEPESPPKRPSESPQVER
ncbi:MAG: hypothetical protein NTY36_01945 [Deltaproteobacteria bacterium]|nr:hypothetical protein [Deltaproteobacteria bacterium]